MLDVGIGMATCRLPRPACTPPHIDVRGRTRAAYVYEEADDTRENSVAASESYPEDLLNNKEHAMARVAQATRRCWTTW